MISSCLMRDIDGPRPTRSVLAKVLLGSPAALADVDEIYFYKKTEEMEASNDGQRCTAGRNSNWLDLDKIYEPRFFLFPKSLLSSPAVSESPRRVKRIQGSSKTEKRKTE